MRITLAKIDNRKARSCGGVIFVRNVATIFEDSISYYNIQCAYLGKCCLLISGFHERAKQAEDRLKNDFHHVEK